MCLRGLIATAVLAALATGAQGAVSTQSLGHTLELGDNVAEGLDVVTLSVDRFDAALGSLTGVEFTLASDFSGGAVFYHPTYSDFGYTPRHTLAVEVLGLADPPELTLDHTLPTQSYTDPTPDWGAASWAPTAQESYTQTVAAAGGTLAQYVGDTPFDLTITLEDRGLYTASNPLAYINDKYVISDLTLTVTYTYTPAVPEPETWAMLLSGLGLVGWAARRRLGRIADRMILSGWGSGDG